ncbi:MAG: endonuclease/exonuclease/phosphatase family metal-dependent hydrolase [Gammaproteobacteria bacterium]|jgi:endonuclease/exonuclease/phosphatase family metal-dependent hydrolase
MIKVLTYNIHKGFDVYNRNFVLHKIRQQLESIDVDMVFLQEIHGQHLGNETNVSGWPEGSQFEFLADQIWPHYAYGKNAIYNNGHHGNAILSKYRFEEWHNINLSRFSRASRSFLHGTVRLPKSDSRLHLICVHFELIGFERIRQLNILKKYIERSIPDTDPIILAGDFNDWSGSTGVRIESQLRMKEVFRASHGSVAKTFPSRWPLLGMDRIYFRGLKLLECERLKGAPWQSMSDHLPLYAKLHSFPLTDLGEIDPGQNSCTQKGF